MARFSLLNVLMALLGFALVSLALPAPLVNSTASLTSGSGISSSLAAQATSVVDADIGSHLEKRDHRLHVNCCSICNEDHAAHSAEGCRSFCKNQMYDHKEKLNKGEKESFLQIYFPEKWGRGYFRGMKNKQITAEVNDEFPGLMTTKGDKKECKRLKKEHKHKAKEEKKKGKHHHDHDHDDYDKRDVLPVSPPTVDEFYKGMNDFDLPPNGFPEDNWDNQWSDDEADKNWTTDEESDDGWTTDEDYYQGYAAVEKRYVRICVRCDAICTPGSSVYNTQACRTVCKHNEDDSSECLNSRQRNALWQAYPSLKNRIAAGVQWSEVKHIIEEELPGLVAN